jgi:hypothetical protein
MGEKAQSLRRGMGNGFRVPCSEAVSRKEELDDGVGENFRPKSRSDRRHRKVTE